jgi:Zn finger protein HypA/HybF involved in hydrogenase expression
MANQFASHQLAAQRKLLASKPNRVCLRCNKKFPSSGPGNRICMACNQANAKVRDGYMTGGLSVSVSNRKAPNS